MRRIWIILIPLLFIAGKAISDNTELKVNVKNIAEVGETFRVTFSLNARGSNFRSPAFENLDVISGPQTSTSSNIQVINGKMSQSIENSYSFYVKAYKEGTAKVGSASVVADGKTYKTEPISINIVKGNLNRQGVNGNNSQRTDKSQESTSQGIKASDLFIKASIDKTSPYQGEEVIITYKIYTRLPLANYELAKAPDFSGFWTKDILDQQQSQREDATINGVQYASAAIYKRAIIPQKSGKIVIAPLSIDATVQIKSKRQRRSSNSPFDAFFDDPFFNNNYANVDTKITSNKITINVKPLPEHNKPASFTNAVGSYKLRSEIDTSKLETNEPIKFKFTISGSGNLELIDNPTINFPPDFDVYDPKISNNIKTNSNGVYGARSFEYLVVPRSSGDFTVGPLLFSFFDPDKGKYVTKESPKYELKIKKGKSSDEGSYYSGISQSEIQYIGEDIHHIFILPFKVKPIDNYFFNSIKFYFSLIIILLVFVVVVIILRKQRKTKSNLGLMRNKHANKLAKQKLKLAKKHMSESKEQDFYNEIATAFWGYIGDKFNIPQSKLFIESIEDALNEKNVNKELISQFVNVLKECEFARFAPGDPGSKMEEIYNEALNVIVKIESELK
ncbi:MAG: BatD family protein [Hyphomicrobiales bacterium]